MHNEYKKSGSAAFFILIMRSTDQCLGLSIYFGRVVDVFV